MQRRLAERDYRLRYGTAWLQCQFHSELILSEA